MRVGFPKETSCASTILGVRASRSQDSIPTWCAVSPGFRPDSAILVQARERGVPVWGEVELAWRLRDPDHDTPWLCVTGTNGKTTTVQMLDGILRAAGLRSQAAGNVGLPIVEAVMDPTPYDVLAVELSASSSTTPTR